MKIDSLWIRTLEKKYGVKNKTLRDRLWPKHPTRSITYFDQYGNPSRETLEMLADILGCTVDEILRRNVPDAATVVSGNNNQIGNVHINSDIKVLQQTIEYQAKLIKQQERELDRLQTNTDKQLKTKDEQIERLIKLAQGQ
jgi:hypothetical protein